MATLSSHSDARKSNQRRVSCETLCSSNSSCVLQKRKPLHPLAASVKRTNNPVTQRVLSAKLLRFKTLQNQLNDANYHITQLVNENKLLKNLQKRQDHALSKYEGANANLPQVLESHQEELRVLQMKVKNLRKTVKEISEQLKNKDEEIIGLKDQNKHLLALCKNKNLEERKELQEKVEDLEEQIRQNESTISTLNRKLLLENKNYKYQLNTEINKHRQTQRELNRIVSHLQESSSKSEIKLDLERKPSCSKTKSQSVVQLCDPKPVSIRKKSSNVDKIMTSSVNQVTDEVPSSNSSSKSRSASPRNETSIINSSKTLEEEELDLSSETQLREIVNSWQKKSNKIEDKLNEDLKKYTVEIMNGFRNNSDMVEKHQKDFKSAEKDTEIIMQALKENDLKQKKLAKLNETGDVMNFYDYSLLSNKTKNDTLIKEILQSDKYNFEDDLLSATTSRSLTISEPEVDQEDKKQLLAKLKAIDNGDNVIVTDVKKTKCDLMKELFGS